MTFRFLKYYLAFFLLITLGTESIFRPPPGDGHKITIRTHMCSEISVFELANIENERFLPKGVNAEFHWDRFQVSDADSGVCYFYRFQGARLPSENLSVFSRSSMFKTAFSGSPTSSEDINEKMLELSERLVKFFDYEYDPSRPSGDSNAEMSKWRNYNYNKMKLNGLIVPGKGSSRLYIRTDTNSAFTGNYFGYLKLQYEDKVEVNPVKLSIGPSPLSMVITGEQQDLSLDDAKVVFYFGLRNHFAFRNLQIVVQTRLEGLEGSTCLVKSEFPTESQTLEIKPGELEKIQVCCYLNGMYPEQIKNLLLIKVNSFWGGSKRYKATYRYTDMARHEGKFDRGVFLSEFVSSYQFSDEYFIFNEVRHRENVMESLRENSTIGAINYNGDGFDFSQYWIMIDLLSISKEVLNLRDIEVHIQIESSSSQDFLRVTFEDQSAEKVYQLDSATLMNSALFLMVNVEVVNTDALIDWIFSSEESGELPILVKTKVFKGERILEKRWKFKVRVEGKDEEFVIRSSMFEGENGRKKIVLNNLDENINLELLNIRNLEKGELEDVEVRLLNIDGENQTLVSKVSFLKIKKYQVGRLTLDLKKLIDASIFEEIRASSGGRNSVQELPYFLEIGRNKRLQLAALANCGKVEVNRKELDFGTVPVSLFGNPNLVQKIELKIERYGKKRECGRTKVSMGFSLSENFILTLRQKKNSYLESDVKVTSADWGRDTGPVKQYVHDFYIEDSEELVLLIEPNFNSPINVQGEKTRKNISTQLGIYTNPTMVEDLNGQRTSSSGNLAPSDKFPKRNLVLALSVKIACTIRGLHVSAGTPHIRSAQHSEIMSQKRVKGGKLPISLFLIEVRNEEEFPVQYSLQREVGQAEREYFAENYAFYVSYESNVGVFGLDESVNSFEEHFSILESKRFLECVDKGTEFFDNLAFNFPINNMFLMNVILVLRLGIVCVYNGEIFSGENSFCIKILPVQIAERVGNLRISMGHLRLNLWQVVVKFDMGSEEAESITGLRLYETGRVDWYFSGSASKNPDEFEMFVPTFISNMDLESAFELSQVIESRRVGKTLRVSAVPWLEVSNEIPRMGYLLPRENRQIAILVHNQIIASSSKRSGASELKCSYNLVFKGLTDIGESLDGSEDQFSRMLLESDQDLRQEGVGMKSLFPLEWTVPNVVNELGYGGGFVKKITLVSSSMLGAGANGSTLESIKFIIEIQNPILCTKERGKLGDDNEDESDSLKNGDTEQDFEEYDHGGSEDRLCTPFNNLELVKGFRVIWYPYNNFSPTNYRSVEISIGEVPRYDFRTGSYSFESLQQRKEEENSEVGQIFTEYIKETGSGDSDFAYLVRVSHDFALGQQYTFKFALTHHENIKNSVFIPPFGFNVTAQSHSLRWLRSLEFVRSDVSRDSRLKELSQMICKGEMDVFSGNNTLVLKWNKEFLKMLGSFSVSYLEAADIIEQGKDEWEVISPELVAEEEDLSTHENKLLFISNDQKAGDGVSGFFYEDTSGENGFLTIKMEDLPPDLKLRIVVDMENYSSERFRCVSKAFQTMKGVPTEPRQFQSVPLTINSVKLSWDTPMYKGGGSEISEYLVTLTPELLSNQSKYKIGNITVTCDKLMVISDRIFPMVTYKVTVQARNEFGFGRPSTIDHVMARGVSSCMQFGAYKLLINESSRRQISWTVENFQGDSLGSLLVYVYCNNRRGVTSSQQFLVELLEAPSVCQTGGGFVCTWVEKDDIVDLRCGSYLIRMVSVVDRSGSEDFVCVHELGSQRIRRLKGDSSDGRRISSEPLVKVHHFGSADELSGVGERRSGVYYPRGYNPGWDNGLIRTVLEMSLSSQNSSLIEMEVNYLFETEGLDEIMLKGKVGDVWRERYYYELDRERGGVGVRDLGDTRSWSMFEESQPRVSGYRLGRDGEVGLVILNLIPEMTVMVSIRELAKDNVVISASRHVLRIPAKGGRVDLRSRKLLSSGVLQVRVDNYFDIREGESSGGRSGAGGRLRSLSEERGGKDRGQITLDVKADLGSIVESPPSSLFVSSKMLVEGWPEDFERRLFGGVDMLMDSGYLEFANGTKQINGSVENYRPVSESRSCGGELSEGGISSLFDGDLETGVRLYNSNSSGGFAGGPQDVIGEEYFPHLSLSFSPPLCILYVRLHWEGNRSPVSTLVSVGLRSRGVSRPRVRSYNPVVHECSSGEQPGREGRVDTIQIIPPEEMVDTYLADPSRRYPDIHNFTLSFAGSCGNSRARQTRDEVALSLLEVEVVPCVSNDLVLSYSDPLSEKSASLVNSEHLLRRSRLEAKYLEVQRIILGNLEREAGGDLETGNLSAKYGKPVAEARILLDLNAVLSEESRLRSVHIPSVRVLLQGEARGDSSPVPLKGNRRLIGDGGGEAPSHVFGYVLYLCANLTWTFLWVPVYISRRRVSS